MLLLTLLTGQRGQALHSLKVSDVRICFQRCVINFSEKQKHTRPGYHTEPATILLFSGKDRLCLVKHFRAYKTKDPRQGEANLFISFVRSHKAVSCDTFSQWVKLVLSAAGIDTEQFGSHSTGLMSSCGKPLTSAAFDQNNSSTSSTLMRPPQQQPRACRIVRLGH